MSRNFNHNKLVFFILVIILLSAFPGNAQIPSYADTLKMGSNLNEPGEIAAVAVRVVNTFAVGGLSLRAVFDQDLFDVHAVYKAERTEDMDYLVVDTTDIGVIKVVVFSLQPRIDYLPAGAGDAVIIEFGISESAAPGYYDLRLENTVGHYENQFTDTTGYQLILPVLGNGTIHVMPPSEIGDSEVLPENYTMLTNYPNPFNSSTVLSLSVVNEGEVGVIIYDMLGRKVKNINLGVLSPGNYTTVWSGRDDFEKEVASGVYCYSLFVNHESMQTKLMSLIR